MRAHSMESRWCVSPCSANSRKSSAYRYPNPLPSPDEGARPASSQRLQSLRGAAPSLCVEDAAVPHQKFSGNAMRELRAPHAQVSEKGPFDVSVMLDVEVEVSLIVYVEDFGKVLEIRHEYAPLDGTTEDDRVDTRVPPRYSSILSRPPRFGAVHVMVRVDPRDQDSPPFGALTVTDGGATGLTEFEGDDAGLLPATLVARTVNV
jgi:hypothetical protein